MSDSLASVPGRRRLGPGQDPSPQGPRNFKTGANDARPQGVGLASGLPVARASGPGNSLTGSRRILEFKNSRPSYERTGMENVAWLKFLSV